MTTLYTSAILSVEPHERWLPLLDTGKSGIVTKLLSDSKPVTPEVTVTEILNASPDALMTLKQPTLENINSNPLQSAFKISQSQWIDDPVVSQWRDPGHKIHQFLVKANDLHETWSSDQERRPFSQSSDPLWLQTNRVLADVGLPWHNNQINMPDEIDTSWPFHFKDYERQVIRQKGARVGDVNASGYVSTSKEANCYCIRALQQELREKHPRSQPILVYDHFDERIVYSAKTFFGLQVHRVNLSLDTLEVVCEELRTITENSQRPVIFAATLATSDGRYDDLDTLCKVSEVIPLMLHVDATRNFDYITTLSETTRQYLSIGALSLTAKPLYLPLRLRDDSIAATTIVAGGANHINPPIAVALKPVSVGGKAHRVAYTRASDSTLAGSRDALSPLYMALQEIRFGEVGLREVYQYCRNLRDLLLKTLIAAGVLAVASRYSLDIIITSCSNNQRIGLVLLGGVLTKNGDIVLTVQPSVKLVDINAVGALFSKSIDIVSESIISRDFSNVYQVPKSTIKELETTVQCWKVATRSAAGYPFHMGSYSALGPIIGHFLDVVIPKEWLVAQTRNILTDRMAEFGLTKAQSRVQFKASFTNGSTMGNRVGIHAALERLPGGFIYFSAETHYSVGKTVRDCDTITNRWSGRGPRFSQIPCDKNGSIMTHLLVAQALVDQEDCIQHGDDYHLILFANMGTTFVGARDDLAQVHARLNEFGIQISHIHVDGALDFGFGDCGIALGLPGTLGSHGMPFVQGITLSHHKAMGSMVSGEVLCFSPKDELSLLEWDVDPRIILETWIYTNAYRPIDVVLMLQYCQDNAARLEAALKKADIATKRNSGSVIVVLERPPSWIIEDFSLRPEGDWVHFITMPHISPETIDLFVSRISWIQEQCFAAFSYVTPLLNAIMMRPRPVKLKRLRCRDPLAKEVAELYTIAIPLDTEVSKDINLDSVINSGIRGAMSVVVVNEYNGLEAVLVLESIRNTSLRVGPLLIKSCYASDATALVDVARQLAGFLGRYTKAPLQLTNLSYILYLI
ncbi:hypothetical protein ABW20_dc0107254 [Dactylellina cionopaga]|nr:hypothetical protein ABW20_dc0107254 [Dactylellina cionopaga]